MPKAAAGTAKAFSNAQKAKGLTKLRFYCQVCEKPCRDENGYKCHIETEGHMRRLQAMTGEKGQLVGKVVDDFSKQFQDGFVSLLSRRFGSRRIKANQVYQEYIADRHHLHMNATRWLSLSEFAKHLGREGIARVEEDENVPGTWYLTWIDNSPEALKRQDALRKMERAKLDDESRQKRFLEEQIRKAKEAAEQKEGRAVSSSASTSAGAEGQAAAPGELKRDDTAQPLKIGFAAKLRRPPSGEAGSSSTASASNDASSSSSSSSSAAGAAAAAASTSSAPTASAGAGAAPIAAGGFKLGFNPLKPKSASLTSSSAAPPRPPMGFNALKAANKPPSSAAAAPPGSSGGSGGSAPKRMTAEERIMMEEMERKRRIGSGSGAGPGAGAGAGAGGNKRIRL